jgi:esterase/lipase
MKKYIEIKYNDYILRGYHHDNASEEVVIMFHGFTGNKSESKLMFKQLSNRFDKENIDSLRVDYLGHGESDGLFKDMIYSDLLLQAKTIIEYTKNIGYKKINILGFSMGGLISLHMLEENINKAIMISPAVDFYANIKKAFETHKRLENGNLDIGGFELGCNFLTSLEGVNPQKYAKSYCNPTLFIVGNEDKAVNFEEVTRVSNEFKDTELHVFDKGDHLYSSLDYYQRLEKTIIAFLKR